MDKYEFNIKVEQIRKMINERDYVTAMKIADSIDWSRVRNANLLSMVAGVYEKNGEYQEAKDILLLAFERAPVGKRLLYKLTEVSVKSGDIEEAEDFYREFADLAPEDSRAFLLEYQILKAKGAPATQLIHSLEQFTSQELDEKWLYELAELYARAGMGAECVRTCDKITLLFGLGKYSERAMQLKQNFTDLSDYQKDLVENRGKYEDNLKRVEEQSAQTEEMYERGYEALKDAEDRERKELPTDPEEIAGCRYEDEDAEFEAYLRAHDLDQDTSEEQMPETSVSYDEGYVNEGFEKTLAEEVDRITRDEEEQPEDTAEAELEKTRVLDEDVKEKLRKVIIHTGHAAEPAKAILTDVEAAKTGAMAQAAGLAAAAAKTSGALPEAVEEAVGEAAAPEEKAEEVKRPEPPRPQARVGFTHTEPAAEKKPEEAPEAEAPAKEEARKPAAESNAEKVAANGPFHMIIEADTAEDGLAIAIDELKYIHNEYGITNAAAKTTAEKLNQKGLSQAAAEKLRGKDFIVEHAGSLSQELAKQIREIIETDRSGMIVVLVDTPEGLDNLEDLCPELFDLCDLVSDEYEEEPEEGEPYDEDSYEEEPYEDASGDPEDDYEDEYEESYEDDSYEEDERQPKKAPARKQEAPVRESRAAGGAAKAGRESVVKASGIRDNQEMEIDEFAQYCCQYAASIDCSITGKSMLALYERIELMEEDNIPLTKQTAEDLIEEAADLAEKPPIGKRIKGMFNSKYDKNGLLILREEDFIH